MANSVLELYGQSADAPDVDWPTLVREQQCPFLDRKCLKTRKSSPEITIGTCTVRYGRDTKDMIICPFRFLERRQVFSDCLHLLQHQPGNELHVIPEVSVPGGSVDYFLASTRAGKVEDFVGVEFQALDTTGTVWPARHSFLERLSIAEADPPDAKPFGMNWKMTAKTTLVQMHHKVETFELLGKHLVLVLQDHLMDYMEREFSFSHVKVPKNDSPMHFHVYTLVEHEHGHRLDLTSRRSTTSAGIGACLMLQADAEVSLLDITTHLEQKLSDATRLQF